MSLLEDKTHYSGGILTSSSIEEISFPISQKELGYITPSGYKQIEHKALIRQDTGEVLYVGKEYKPIPNADVVVETMKLEKEGWRLESVKAYKSQMFFLSYIHDDVRFKIGGLEAKARLQIINSYDGSAALQIQAGAHIVVCGNGLTTGKGVNYRRKHTTGVIDFAHEIETIQKKILPEMIRKVEQKEWTLEDLDKVKSIFKALTKPYLPSSNGAPNKFVMALNDRFVIETKNGYQGELGLMMAATHIVTHQYKEHSPSYIMRLEKDIPKVFFQL